MNRNTVRLGARIVEVKKEHQNLFLIFENDHSKLRTLVYSRLKNQRIWSSEHQRKSIPVLGVILDGLSLAVGGLCIVSVVRVLCIGGRVRRMLCMWHVISVVRVTASRNVRGVLVVAVRTIRIFLSDVTSIRVLYEVLRPRSVVLLPVKRQESGIIAPFPAVLE